MVTKMKNRIVVCAKCGQLYDLHYVEVTRYRKDKVYEFYCQNCGLMPILYKNWK